MENDSKTRCSWVGSNPLYVSYHDEEWGTPCHNERDHYMYLLMESMSCGLSWLLMLKKREIFRECFAGFDPQLVAAFTDDDVLRILATPGMIRSEQKVRAMINNAQCFLKVQQEFGTFDSYIWSFSNGRSMAYPEHDAEPVTRNDLSDAVSKDLKKRGFKYVGSVIIYSHLQAIGMINDHACNCFRYKQLTENI